ncbi:MAG: SIS domain-containing protein [Candidatus Tantalella remota]|nr:SIS domain-containing protein [Candidatus Tantalella remota]
MDAEGLIRGMLESSIKTKQEFLSDEGNISAIRNAATAVEGCLRRGGKILVFGNGGSAADSQHLAAELVVRFEKEREALACIALTTDTSVITALANDYDFDKIFSRQVEALASPADMVVAISTSGNSPNVLEGVRAAKKKDIPVMVMTGRDGGELIKEADMAVLVKEENTARIQEVHVTVIHIICSLVEGSFAQ